MSTLRVVVFGAAMAALTLNGCGSTTSDPEQVDSSAPVTPTASAPPTAASTTEWPVVPAPALEGNLVGDRPELRVAVWLPPSYSVTDVRFPVVYFLAGFEEAASVASIGAALDDAIAAGEAPEVIVVGVSGRNALGGSFYVDSPVTGGWATAVHRDLVEWMDASYRTIAEPGARVIAGFSMGGFGAFDLAMRHPDVFGAVYALSPGALAPGGLADMEMFAAEGAIESYLTMQAAFAADEDPPTPTEGARFALAYGSAFAPNVDAGPPWVDYPFVEPGDDPDPVLWATWEAGYGGIEDEVREHRDDLRSLLGIALDVGTEDTYQWIPAGTRHLAETLEASGIPVQFTTYPGGHGPVSVRASETLVPFLAEVLSGLAGSGVPADQ